jgi:phage terminase large subunit-like protein
VKSQQPVSPSTNPHVSLANEYAERVVRGKIPACKWVKLACKRHLDDLKRQKQRNWPYRFDPVKAERPCRFIELLPHVKGKWAARGERIKLEPWQCFALCSLFGWVLKASGHYRFREAYIKVPRKNSKSTLAAGIGLFKFCADGEYGAEVYSGATSEKQAWEVFRPAKQMVERTPKLIEAYGITVNAKSLTIPSNGSRFEPVIGKPGDGASPSCAIVDEYHEHPDDTLYDTMKTGMGARENPLLPVITTAGADLSGPCYSLEVDAQKMLEGKIENERLFAIMYGIDPKDDWKTEAALRKANPNYGVSVFSDFLLDAQRDAINNARKQNIFKTKHLNEWVTAGEPFFNIAKWDELADESLTVHDFVGCDCIAAIDLASKVDTASKVRLFWRDLPVSEDLFTEDPHTGHCCRFGCENAKDEAEPVQLYRRGKTKRLFCEECVAKIVTQGERHFYAFLSCYLNEAAVESASNSHYSGWANSGHLIVTPGNVNDYVWMGDDLVKDASEFHLIEIPHDPYHAAALVQFIQAREDWPQEIPFVEYRQTVEKMSPAMYEAEAVLLDGRLHHDGNPVFGWMMSNVIAQRDKKGNVFPRKQREQNKIDGAVSLMMSIARAVGAGLGGAYTDPEVMVV